MPIKLPDKLAKISGVGGNYGTGISPHGGKGDDGKTAAGPGQLKNRQLIHKILGGYVTTDGYYYAPGEAMGVVNNKTHIFTLAAGDYATQLAKKSNTKIIPGPTIEFSQVGAATSSKPIKKVSPPAAQSLLQIARAIGDKPAASNLIDEIDDTQVKIQQAKSELKKGSFAVAGTFVVFAVIGVLLLRNK